MLEGFDYFDPDPEQNRIRSAHHEAAHAVLSWCFGIPIREVAIWHKGGHCIRSEEVKETEARFGAVRGKRVIAVITRAGLCAQKHMKMECPAYGCDEDSQQMRRAAAEESAITGEKESAVTGELLQVLYAEQEAQVLVDLYWHRIEALAQALLVTPTMDGREAFAIIEAAKR
jgi:hypothetical protein